VDDHFLSSVEQDDAAAIAMRPAGAPLAGSARLQPEAGERISRIGYGRDARVAGIFFLPMGTA
jgi:hypothetical protein